METCGGCGATLGPQEQFCGACGRFRSDATNRVWPPQDATAPQAWPPPQDQAAPQQPAYGAAPGYGAAPYQPVPGYYYGGVAPATTTNTLAIISLISSLVGFVVCFVTAFVAIPTGHIALSQIKRSEQATGPYVARESGRGLAIAGLIISYCQLALLVGWILLIAASDA